MGIQRNKQRGYEFESELVRQAEAAGLDAERAWGSNGRALGLAPTVDLAVAGKALQAKRRKQLAAYLQIPHGCDAVVFRQDGSTKRTLVLMSWDDYLELIR